MSLSVSSLVSRYQGSTTSMSFAHGARPAMSGADTLACPVCPGSTPTGGIRPELLRIKHFDPKFSLFQGRGPGSRLVPPSGAPALGREVPHWGNRIHACMSPCCAILESCDRFPTLIATSTNQLLLSLSLIYLWWLEKNFWSVPRRDSQSGYPEQVLFCMALVQIYVL